MRGKIAAVAVVAFALGAATAWADPEPVKLVPYSVKIKGTFPDSSTAGACPHGFANYCPSTHCTCFTATGTVTGSAGKGAMTFYETFDNEGNTADNEDCGPAYGDIEIVGSKDTESISFVGSDCSIGNFLSGGCNLPLPSTLFSSGGGICSGPYVPTGGVGSNFAFSIKGKAARK